MVQFADISKQGIDTFSTCPAQIIVFFKYESRGIPTPELIDNNLSLADIKDQNMLDNAMYAVIHMATSYVSWKKIGKVIRNAIHSGSSKKNMCMLFQLKT
jgi:hypothetical protein